MTKDVTFSNSDDSEDAFDEIIAFYDEIRTNHTKAAIHAGEEMERIQLTRPFWKKINSLPNSDPDLEQMKNDANGTILAFRNRLAEMNIRTTYFVEDFIGMSPSSDSIYSMTSASQVFVDIPTQFFLPSDLLDPKMNDNLKTIEKLRRIDPSLAKTYSSVREMLYGTTFDPERGAMYQLRQVFDHYFSILAPDVAVRNSEFFTPKESGDKNSITRLERIHFAANTHIKDIQQRNTLIGLSKHMLDVYKLLNKAHKKGDLDSGKAREALREMLILIRDWVNALEES